MINDETVRHIADLARIGISDHEVEKFAKDLGAVLDYVKVLEAADTSDVEPIAHSMGHENAARPDDPEAFSVPNVQKTLLEKQAPHTKEGYIVVPRVLE